MAAGRREPDTGREPRPPELSRWDAHPFRLPDGGEDRCALCGEPRAQIRHHPTRVRAARLLLGLGSRAGCMTDRRDRPWWASGLAGFCALTVVFLVARDLLVPHVRDTEVWLGLELRGWPARLTAPLHWALWGAGAWGFWRLRPWIWPWASVYAFTIAVSHLVWNLTSPHGGGWSSGLWQLALFSVPAVALLRARPPRPGG